MPKLTGSVHRDCALLKSIFHAPRNADFIVRTVSPHGVEMAVLYVDGMANRSGIEDMILRPLMDMRPFGTTPPGQRSAVLLQRVLPTGTGQLSSDTDALVPFLLAGNVVVLCDGSFGDIPLENYNEAADRVISELQELGKPFVIVLNSVHPQDEQTLAMAQMLEENYGVAVLPINAAELSEADLLDILNASLYEFPISEINIMLPPWVQELEREHPLRSRLEQGVALAVSAVHKVRDIPALLADLTIEGLTGNISLNNMSLGSGVASIGVAAAEGLFYKVLSEYAGETIDSEAKLLPAIRKFSRGWREWDKMKDAMSEVYEHGYGVVTPRMDEMYLEEPELFKQGGSFGVRLKASAPSYHIIRANISTEITPLVGSEHQCQELMRYMLDEFEDDPQKIWSTNVFGKSLSELVSEGISGKLYRMPEDAQEKLQETLQRIVNENGGGVICIVL